MAAVALRNSALSTCLLLFALLAPAPFGRAEVKEKRQKPEQQQTKHEDRRDNDRDRSQGKRGDDDQARFRGMDRDNDGLISRFEWRGNDKSFANHDSNHDGIISGEELRGGGRNVGAARWDGYRFDALDANNDARVSRGEWDGTFNANDGRAAFERFDINKDGVLSREEFPSRTSGVQVPDALLRDLDHNRDGKLSREEWQGRQDFERLDRNRDGYLSQNELARQ